ncbi:MAG: sulfurtransferase, partial [Casimicrobiaceae bacterium]
APHALAREFAEFLGPTPPSRIIHQCGSGVSACHNILAMAHAGYPQTSLFPGSWSEWVADRSRPVATGPR